MNHQQQKSVNVKKYPKYAFYENIATMCNHPTLTKEEEVELANKIKEGDEDAFHKLIACNIKLVASIAKSCFSLNDYLYEDMISSGIIGLMRAARKFDPDRGVRFSTFAVWSIRSAIYDGYRTCCQGAVTLPKDAIRLIARRRDGDAIPERRAATIDSMEAAMRPIRSVGDSDCPIVGDESDYDQPAFPPEAMSLMNECMELLDESDRNLLSMRYGLAPYTHPMTYKEVAKELGLSYEWARVKEKNARDRLRALMIDQRSKCQGVPSDI